MTPRSTKPIIFPRSIKGEPGTPRDSVVKRELSPCSGTVALRQLNFIHEKGPKSSFNQDPNSIPIKIEILLRWCIRPSFKFLTHYLPLEYFVKSLKLQKLSRSIKKDSKLEYSNYRPIPLLHNKNKIKKQLMHESYMKFLTGQKILHLERFGFRQNISNVHVIAKLKIQ